MAVVTRSRLINSSGQQITLAREIGRGGEGVVFEVAGRQRRVAKIFHQVPPEKHAQKLHAMVKLSTPEIRGVAAWPVDTLRDESSGQVSGILLPHAGERQPIHQLYSPKTRVQEFPAADWRFLTRTAKNVAIVINAIHRAGHVVGDINEPNILVGNDATVYLIDCDSFQVTYGANTFTCDVGVLTYTPPELQGQHLRGFHRTPNHDHFGLAVLIFHLLCMGRHPFSGDYLDRGDMPIERAIREFRYAYSAHSPERRMKPPPGTLSMSLLSPRIQELFEKAFRKQGIQPAERPTSDQWIQALQDFEKQLRPCSRVESHFYARRSPQCPWCVMQKATRTDFFPAPVRQLPTPKPAPPPPPAFDADAAWRKIVAVTPPEKPPQVTPPSARHADPAPETVQAGAIRRDRRNTFLKYTVGYGFLPIFLTLRSLSLGSSEGGVYTVLFLALLIFIVALHHYSNWEIKDIRDRYFGEWQAAQDNYKTASTEWTERASLMGFTRARGALEQTRREYKRSVKLREMRISEIKETARESQFENYLKRARLTAGAIPDIGVARVAMLRSNGIESAYDISESSISEINGFGEALTRSLLDWRRRIEKSFKFDPSRAFTAEDAQRVDAEYGPSMRQLEQKLSQGPATLNDIREEITAAQKLMRDRVEKSAEELAQAQANWNAL